MYVGSHMFVAEHEFAQVPFERQRMPDVLQVGKFARQSHLGSCGRVVKALDLKSNSLWERRFEPCRLRYPFDRFKC